MISKNKSTYGMVILHPCLFKTTNGTQDNKQLSLLRAELGRPKLGRENIYHGLFAQASSFLQVSPSRIKPIDLHG